MLKRILMLDDHKDILDVVKEVLSYEKFEVRITSSSEHIMEIMRSFRPDLVIMDYKLNGASGDAICKQIKKHPDLHHTPVVICSAYLNKNDLLTCGCDAIISKPFGLDELLDKVNNLLMEEVNR